MAEFCKDCFKKYLLSSEDRERIKDENIIMFPTKDLCEGCGEIKLVVDYVIWEEDWLDISLEDMRTMIQEWFSQADNLCDLAEIYYTIRDESTTQFEFMAEEIVNRVKQ